MDISNLSGSYLNYIQQNALKNNENKNTQTQKESKENNESSYSNDFLNEINSTI